MTILFPGLKPYQTYHWDVDDVHTLYVEESGNPKGLPILFLHGGPGGACSDYNRQFFDPTLYRIIMFDQRGCGRSKPHAKLQHNTTAHILADMELIRERLSVERWILFGGSWGSTLAVLYAQQYSEKVVGVILRGVFLARDTDINWLFQDGASRVFPQQWKKFVSVIKESQRGQIVEAYFELLTGENELKAMEAALLWAEWEASCSALIPNAKVIKHSVTPYTAMSLARLECHYMMRRCFLDPDQLLLSSHKLAGIPAIIVHGRYDMVCPVEQAVMLHESWAGSELNIIKDAGHAATEPGIMQALVNATKSMSGTMG